MADTLSPSDAQPEGFQVSHEDLTRLGGGDAAAGRAKLRLLLADEKDRAPISGPVERPSNVRLATIQDEPALLDLLLRDLDENAKDVAPPSVSRICRMMEMGTRNRGGFTLVVDGPDGPCAVACVHPDPWWWSDLIFLREIVLYVAPEARSTSAAHDLLQYECWLADQMSADLKHRVYVLAGVTAPRRSDAKARLYSRHMNRIGSFFVYPAIEGGVSL